MIFRFGNTLETLRSIGFWEAISSILLFFVAMPLKYIWGNDSLIRPIGMAHGILFLAYVVYIFLGQRKYKWASSKTVWLLIASLVPGAPIIADAKILADIDPNRRLPEQS